MTTITVEPDPLEAGGTATVCIEHGQGSSSMTVTIDDGGDKGDEVNITLDDHGDGCAEWPVPTSGWDLANFNTPGATTVTRPIV